MTALRLRRAALLGAASLLLPAAAMAQAQPAPAPAATPAAAPTRAETVVVRGRFIPEPMRTTSEVASFLSAEDLARTGDANAAVALTRLTGLSIVSERFVFVRGLGDRYSSALLNGSPLPSPEPLRRQVPLDLFPSNIIDGATVQKTFSPNYPGEFGGGIIDLTTLKTPLQPFFTVKTGTGFNTESTLQEGFVVRGSSTDWLGVDDGLRERPGALRDAIGRGRKIVDGAFTPAELETIGESLVNSPLTVIQRTELTPDFEAEFSAGQTFDFGDYRLGLVAAGGYSSEQRTREAKRTEVVGDAIDSSGVNVASKWDVVLNAFGSASLGWGDHEVTLTGLLVRSSTKDAQVFTGTDPDLPANQSLRSESSAWYERQLASLQIAGEHRFGDLDLKWRGSYAQSTREAPYERSVVYSVVDGVASFQAGNTPNETRFSDLTDEVLSGGADLTYTTQIGTRELVVSGGVVASQTDRDFEILRFAFTGPRGPTPSDVLRARIDFLFSPDNIDPRRFVLNETTGKDDAYVGELTNTAAYVGLDGELTSFIRAAIGLRYEDSEQRVVTGNRFGETPTAPVNISKSYVLPAATFTWNFADDLQLRLGYSQTIARPQFRELAFTPFIDPDTDRTYEGNPFLTDSEFKNYDARLEYYFGRGQFVTGAVFYKTIENPIEEVIVPAQSGATITRFLNAPEASLYGAEVEFRTTFEMPFAVPFLVEPTWLFNINYTYTSSEVTAGSGSTVVSPIDFRRVAASQFGLDGSELQGTPEHIVNLQFGYETDMSQLTLIAGYVSERIAQRGLGALPTVFDEPGVTLDLVLRQDVEVFGTLLTFGASGRNLLGTDFQEYQVSRLGRTDYNTYARGRSFSFSVTAKW